MFLKPLVLILAITTIHAGTINVRAVLQRSADKSKEAATLVTHRDVRPFWSSGNGPFIYRVSGDDGDYRFVLVDPSTGKKSPAFDHEAFAKSLAAEVKHPVKSGRLPVDSPDAQEDGTIRFRAFGASWSYDSSDGKITSDKREPAAAGLLPPGRFGRGGHDSGAATQLIFENETEEEIELFWLNGPGKRKSYGKIAPKQSSTQETYAGHKWLVTIADGTPLAGVRATDRPTLARITGRVKATEEPGDNLSPDGRWQAYVRESNIEIQPAGGGEIICLSTDGTDDLYYSGPFHWSPDSRKLVAFRTNKVVDRKISMVQSSPPDQVQPKLKTIDYPKPGDPIKQPKPKLFDINVRREIVTRGKLSESPWRISDLAWSSDSSGYSFVYNQRGHQVMRMVGIRADTGEERTIFEDTSKTFIDYSQKYFLHRVPGTCELIWASERDGYNHLYLIDGVSGAAKPITLGGWNVRDVVEVDDAKRSLLIKIVGVDGQNPYHEHFARVNFDGSGFIRLTEGDGNHAVRFSPDHKFLLDEWSRVDLPPVSELRRAEDGKLIAELERSDDGNLQKTGWSRPERFVSKGRDGKTDIHGIIVRPTDFDPAKRYPVVEQIYAGPHDHFVPTSYFTWSGLNTMADLGFIIVQIDGMGTNWRGKEFHDVCWKNLADAGFPDRIPWIKAAAASRPWMDLTRIGIYGGSAGGQNALSGLLHHGDFYKVGVADCGCHDNRMDKIWWNEAWMGWPVDESYARNSNVTDVAKLTGKLMLIVGELDTNVDPASTAQVVHALQNADKDFEFVPVMNANHGAAETPYGKRRRADFLVRNLIDSPPESE